MKSHSEESRELKSEIHIYFHCSINYVLKRFLMLETQHWTNLTHAKKNKKSFNYFQKECRTVKVFTSFHMITLPFLFATSVKDFHRHTDMGQRVNCQIQWKTFYWHWRNQNENSDITIFYLWFWVRSTKGQKFVWQYPVEVSIFYLLQKKSKAKYDFLPLQL